MERRAAGVARAARAERVASVARRRRSSGPAAHVSQLGGGVGLVERKLLAVERECERQQRGQRRLDPPPRAEILRAAHRAVAVARGAQGASAAHAATGGGRGPDGLGLLRPAGAVSRGGGHDVVREVAAARLRDARRPAAARRSDAVRCAHERRAAAARGAAVRGRRGSGHEGGVVADLGLTIAGGQGVGGRGVGQQRRRGGGGRGGGGRRGPPSLDLVGQMRRGADELSVVHHTQHGGDVLTKAAERGVRNGTPTLSGEPVEPHAAHSDRKAARCRPVGGQ